jgi:ADP-ribose pyrophosphatase
MIVAMNRSVQIQTPYDGRLFKVEVLSWADERGRRVTREVVRHPGAVLVIPVIDANKLVLIQNERVAVNEVLWEFPAGKLEPGEKPQCAAARELEEETGYQAADICKLGEFYTSPGFTNELMHVFVAERLTKAAQRLEPGEHIAVHIIPVDDVAAMALDGRIRDGKSIAGFGMWRAKQSHVVESGCGGSAT